MTKEYPHTKKLINEIDKVQNIESMAEQLQPLDQVQIDALPPIRYSAGAHEAGYKNRIEVLHEAGHSTEYIQGLKSLDDVEQLKGNIENYIGMAQIPIGMAGPVLVNGTAAKGDFLVPMATTEGALVASYNRGMKACRLSGGVTSVCLVEGVQRAPLFKFKNIMTVGIFIKWVHERMETFVAIVKETSRFAQLNEMKTNIQGNSVLLIFEYSTGDAAGQNMVTICTDQICKYILAHFEIAPLEWYIESNYSGDKKATAVSFSNVRGKKVTAEVVLPRKVVEEVLKTTPEKITKYCQSSTLAVIQSGAIGAQGHIANGLTALFIACGQDVACISESSVGLTRMEINEEGNLYVSLTLPSLIVGTIGGGTGLPTQQECLSIMDCAGIGKARKFAEICCAVALAGEISIASAMSADHFTKAHQQLGRKKP